MTEDMKLCPFCGVALELSKEYAYPIWVHMTNRCFLSGVDFMDGTDDVKLWNTRWEE